LGQNKYNPLLIYVGASTKIVIENMVIFIF